MNVTYLAYIANFPLEELPITFTLNPNVTDPKTTVVAVQDVIVPLFDGLVIPANSQVVVSAGGCDVVFETVFVSKLPYPPATATTQRYIRVIVKNEPLTEYP